MELLVEKPQFDVNALKLGAAIWVEDISYMQEKRKLNYNSHFKSIKSAAIVIATAPLEIDIVYWDGKNSTILTITVDLVADKLIAITLMEVAK